MIDPNAVRSESAAALPVQMCVEATRWCNLKCPNCRRTVFGLEGREPISAPVLQAFADAFPLMDQIAISGWGESLYGQNIWELLKVARRAGISFSVTTNASLLTEANARRLIDAQAGFVSVSMDAGTPEGYRRFRPGGVELETVASNMQGLAQLRDRIGSPFPFMGANFVLYEETAAEMEPLVRLLAKIGVPSLCVQPQFLTEFPAEGLEYRLSPRAIEAYESAMAAAHETGVSVRQLLPEITDVGLGRYDGDARRMWFMPSRERIREEKLVATCKTAWEGAFMNMDGDLFPCGFYPEPLGNIAKEGSFEAAWNNDAFLRFRRGLQSGNPPEPCVRCRYTLWHKAPDAAELRSEIDFARVQLEGLGYHVTEWPAGHPPFRWTRGVCDFYLANSGARWFWLEARGLDKTAEVSVEINGIPCGDLQVPAEWGIWRLLLPEIAERQLHVTLRCKNPVRDPSTPFPWQRRRLLGIAVRKGGLSVSPELLRLSLPPEDTATLEGSRNLAQGKREARHPGSIDPAPHYLRP